MDDTPAANAETRAWLNGLEPASFFTGCSRNSFNQRSLSQRLWIALAGPGSRCVRGRLASPARRPGAQGFRNPAAGYRTLAFGRERFRRKMQLVEMWRFDQQNRRLRSRSSMISPVMIETHKLDEWEDPGLVAAALGTIMKLSLRIQNDKAQQQKIFERICRLDPAQALGDGK